MECSVCFFCYKTVGSHSSLNAHVRRHIINGEITQTARDVWKAEQKQKQERDNTPSTSMTPSDCAAHGRDPAMVKQMFNFRVTKASSKIRRRPLKKTADEVKLVLVHPQPQPHAHAPVNQEMVDNALRTLMEFSTICAEVSQPWA
jgi:hypothetical protein